MNTRGQTPRIRLGRIVLPVQFADMTREFSASPSSAILPLILTLGVAFIFSALAALNWDNAFLSGIFLLPVLLGLLGTGILLYRIVLRPVMLRVSPEGLYIKRLGTLVPWEAIARIERINFKGDTLFSILETETGHPVFDKQALLLGAAMNLKAGLPPLAIAMSQYNGTPADFEAAVTAASAIDITDGLAEQAD